MITKERQVEIVRAIGRAVALCSHYQTLNKRVVPFIEKELAPFLSAHNPSRTCDGFTVRVDYDPGTYFLHTKYEIKVWGGVFNAPDYISYEDAVHFSWRKEDKSETWYAGFLREYARKEITDVIEREQQEEALVDAIVASDLRIQKLLSELRREREETCAMFALLPEPPSTTIRKGHYVWKEPTEKMKARFPRVFKNDNKE